MIKIIDLDKAFDKYISGYVYKNIGKVKPEEIEDRIPVLYEQFGDESLPELDGKTPNTYYKEFSATELVSALKNHVDGDISVSDFLCEALIEKPDAEDAILKALKEDSSEEFISYLLNVYQMINSQKGLNEILGFVLYDYGETVKELATEILSCNADLIKDEILESYAEADDKVREYLTEILSKASKDDKVFSVLIAEFVSHPDKVAEYAGYLVKYGDERALEYLYTAIENEKIGYADFSELRFSIEALGGEYNKKRDFTADKEYGKIKGKKNKIV